MPNKYKGVGINLRLEYIDEFLIERPDVDFVEIILDNYHSKGPHHRKLEKVREDYGISFHCVGMNIGGVDPINKKYLRKTRELIKRFSPFQVSDHLCFQSLDGISFHDLLPFPLTEEFLESTIKRVTEIQDHLDQQILIENLSYYTEYKESQMSEVDFINTLTSKCDAKILLDLNNIWVNEKNLKISSEVYLEKVNWKSVGEIHLAGAEKFGDIYVDTHGSEVDSEVLELCSRNKDKIKNIPVVYERDNNLPKLDELLKQRDIIKEVIYEK